MKVLLIAHFFPPTYTAGAEKRAFGYALALRALGHEVQVVCAGSWNAGARHWNGYLDDVYQGIPVRRVFLNWPWAKDPNRALYDNPVVEEHLGDWLEEWQPDVAHVISLYTLSASAVRAVKKRGIPVVFTLVDFWMICPRLSLVRGDGSLCDGKTTAWECLRCSMWNSGIYGGLSKVLPERTTASALTWASRRPALHRLRGLRGLALDMADRKRVMAETAQMCDRITAPSESLARLIEGSGILAQPVRVIRSGHDLAWLENAPPRQPAEALRFGYIGQLAAHKGVHLLIEAYQAAAAQIGDGCRPVELRIYGDLNHEPAYTAQLQAMVRLGDSIQFMGAFPHSELGSVLAQMDVLVVPSQWHENNPRVIQEAFAAKTPVIASNVRGIAEFTRHGIDGLLFRHDSADDLRDQMLRLVREPGLLDQMRAAIPPVKTIAEEISEIVALYREVTTHSDSIV